MQAELALAQVPLPATVLIVAVREKVEDDPFRDEAVFWFVHLKIQHFREQGMNGPDIQERTGISKSQISQIERGMRTGGLRTVMRLAKADGSSPGELLDAALNWWDNHGGAEYRARQLEEIATKRSTKKPAKKAATTPRRAVANSVRLNVDKTLRGGRE